MTTGPTKVLIIQGDSDSASLIDAYLRCAHDCEERLSLTRATRLSSACRLLTRQDFDVLLLDLNLPLVAGQEGYLKLQALRPSIPVIILTGKKDEDEAARAVKLGAQDYFIIGSQDCLLLKRAIRYAVERKRQAGELEALLAADAAPRLVLDAGGVVRFANAAVEPLFERAAASLLGKPFGHASQNGAELILTSVRAKEKRAKVEVRTISWHGKPARLISLLTDPPSRGLGPLPVEADRVLSVLDARKHFLSRISHELRNTLATMKTAAYCLKDGTDDKLTAPQTQMVDMISRNIDRQNRLIENILDLFRFRSGRLKVERQETDPADIIRQLAEEYRLANDAPRLRVSVADGLPRISCDPDLIAQVLRNLVDNALRFAKEAIVIEAASPSPDEILISVTDDGQGIHAQHLGGLFTRFLSREGPESVASHKGIGLGLTICKEIIESHHGRIWAENEPAHGARFSFSLPVRDGAERAGGWLQRAF